MHREALLISFDRWRWRRQNRVMSNYYQLSEEISAAFDRLIEQRTARKTFDPPEQERVTDQDLEAALLKSPWEQMQRTSDSGQS